MKQRRQSLTLVVLGLLSLVLSHQLVFFLAHGASVHEAALEAGGHRAYWLPFAFSVVLIAGGLALTALVQIRRLQRSLASNTRTSKQALGDIPAAVAHIWVRVLALACALFLLQENVEHLVAGAPIPVLSALWGADYGPALLVIAVVSAAVALVAGLIRWRHDALARLIAGVPARHRPRRSSSRPRVVGLAIPESLLGRCKAGRAPPRALRA